MTMIKDEDIFKSVARDNHYRGRQKVNDWYWDCDELVFCNNIPEYGGEHYTQEVFVRQMANHFAGIESGSKVYHKFVGQTGYFVFIPNGEAT